MSNSTIATVRTIVYIIEMIIAILTIIAWWKIFKKAGQAGWKSIIPFYDGHILYGICWKPVYFWLTLIFTSGGVVLQDLFIKDQAQPNLLIALLVIAMLVVGIILLVKFCLNLAKSFGKGTGFAIGLMFLNTLFSLILGFGKAEYIGNMSAKKPDMKTN